MVGWLSSCLCGCLFCDLTCCERVRAFCFTDFWPAGTCLFVCILPQFQRVLVTDLSKLNFWSASHDTRLATLGKILWYSFETSHESRTVRLMFDGSTGVNKRQSEQIPYNSSKSKVMLESYLGHDSKFLCQSGFRNGCSNGWKNNYFSWSTWCYWKYQ